jgi:hypothetical protein
MRELIKGHGYRIGFIASVLDLSDGQLQYRLNKPSERFSVGELETISSKTKIPFKSLLGACSIDYIDRTKAK